MYLDLEHSRLARKLLGVVLVREGDVHFALVARLASDQLLLKSRDEALRTYLERIILSLAALERHSVGEALEVDNSGVAAGDGAIDGLYAGVALEHTLQLVVCLVLSDADRIERSLDALIIGHGYLRLDRNERLEGVAVLVDLLDLHLRLADSLDARLFQSGVVRAAVALVYRVLPEEVLAVHALDHLAGRLALAEAGQGYATALLCVCRRARSLKLFRRHLDDQFDRALLFLFTADKLHKN